MFDTIIESARIGCGVQNLLCRIREAKDTDKEQCGHCFYWMKSSQCPGERNVKGRNVGPSVSGIVCGKYIVQNWVAELKKKRVEAIKEDEFFKYIGWQKGGE